MALRATPEHESHDGSLTPTPSPASGRGERRESATPTFTVTMSVSVQAEDFDTGAEIARLSAGRTDVGAVASFVGLVRGEGISDMTLEHYPGMTEKALEDIVIQAQARWPLLGARVIHRVGQLRPGEQIVLVAVAASHRGEAFLAAEFIMDYLKTQAPFWKKETTPEGGRWVDARDSDHTARARWGQD